MGSWLLVLVRKFYKINQNLKKYKPIYSRSRFMFKEINQYYKKGERNEHD